MSRKKVTYLIIATLVFAVVSLFAIERFQPEGFSPREVLDSGVAKLKVSQKLSPDQEELLRLQLALVDFMVKKTHPPDALEELVPVYFDAVPLNPITVKPYEYQRQGPRYRLGEQAVFGFDRSTFARNKLEQFSSSRSIGERFFMMMSKLDEVRTIFC